MANSFCLHRLSIVERNFVLIVLRSCRTSHTMSPLVFISNGGTATGVLLGKGSKKVQCKTRGPPSRGEASELVA